ncbi:NAD(P)-binding domain-containing protein [Halobacteria archaeon AArc-m2/3/4]|uniref:NAD(P)-binding domain-containing protein n=1 Tax=Natronoglomus mannanivorans TaxID=2979990 RepID=A0ABT2QK16_9EURY|nr:NAD(P)-binding domain-containing protein [Halobacteria archaeon AArc-m2/3/4]
MEREHAVGVVGVGTMGQHFVEWLLEDGFPVFVFDVDDDRIDVAEASGATGVSSPAALADRAETVVLSLPGSQYVERVMEGGGDGDDTDTANGILATLGEGQLVVDTGTTRVETDLHYARECRDRDAHFVDAPLTWSGPGNRPTMFVGASEEGYARARPVLEVLSAQHHHFGGLGSGQIVKAGHRLRQNNMAMVDAEMVEFLRNNGVDPEAATDLLDLDVADRLFEETYPSTEGWAAATETETETATAGTDGRNGTDGTSEASDDTAPDGLEGARTAAPRDDLCEGAVRPRMAVSHWAKDHAYAIEIGHASNTALPVSSAVYQAMLASQNYAESLFDRELGFQDPDWFDRADPISHFRRLNRPAEEWRRVGRNDSDGLDAPADPADQDPEDDR